MENRNGLVAENLLTITSGRPEQEAAVRIVGKRRRTGRITVGMGKAYEAEWLLRRCSAAGTVLHSRLPFLPEESGSAYVRRLAALVQRTGARVILRVPRAPSGRGEAEEMLGLWHELTAPPRGRSKA